MENMMPAADGVQAGERSHDEDFEDWILKELRNENPALCDQYESLVATLASAISKWRQRFLSNIPVWRRIFSPEKVVKEVLEALPILDLVVKLVESMPDDDGQSVTIVDLASGKGYLSMLLSEILPPAKVTRILLIDNQWPMQGFPVEPHHICNDHIYGVDPSTHQSYTDSWPIPLQTTKQDLKKSRTLNQLEERLFAVAQGPILILAVHLCGTLSIKAVEMFNRFASVKFLALKPCCLPGMVHVKKKTIFALGNHSFDAAKVCSFGKWKKNKWHGPPRHQLQKKFHCWSDNLFLGVVVEPDGAKTHVQYMVQTDGGFQNSFIIAERSPVTSEVWKDLPQHQEALECIPCSNNDPRPTAERAAT